MVTKNNNTKELNWNAEPNQTNTKNMNTDNISVLAIAFQCFKAANKLANDKKQSQELLMKCIKDSIDTTILNKFALEMSDLVYRKEISNICKSENNDGIWCDNKFIDLVLSTIPLLDQDL